jgi:hypothetical protein
MAMAALAVPALAADHPGQTVEIKTKITTNGYASSGKVTATNANCVEGRQVVVKEVGVGKIGAAKTDDAGVWKAQPNYKGDVPFNVYAEVKPVSQGTADTIYKCLGARTRTLEISGG